MMQHPQQAFGESHLTPSAQATDYLAVASEWHHRGFFTTPVKPGAKHPVSTSGIPALPKIFRRNAT